MRICPLHIGRTRLVKQATKLSTGKWFRASERSRTRSALQNFRTLRLLLHTQCSSFGFRLVKGEHKNTFQPPESLTPQLITKSEIEKDRYYNALYVNRSFVSEEDRQSERTFRAIEWFNRSFLYSGHGIDASEAIVSIHTALEALLRLDH